MSNPTDPDKGQSEGHPEPTDDAPETEVFESTPAAEAGESTESDDADDSSERRFTAPSGFDGSTQIIDAVPEPATEIFAAGEPTEMIDTSKVASPQVIPPRDDAPKPPHARRSWGWVIAVVLVILALVALAILGTVLLTRDAPSAASQEEQVRSTIQSFDIAIQKGDLATLRGITCGNSRESYVQYDDHAWTETHQRVAAAKQYPVVASIDEVVVVDTGHAEANVTTFMAFAPQTRSTRSFDLQFRDDQWKICQHN